MAKAMEIWAIRKEDGYEFRKIPGMEFPVEDFSFEERDTEKSGKSGKLNLNESGKSA
jgi:hypothetical protein